MQLLPMRSITNQFILYTIVPDRASRHCVWMLDQLDASESCLNMFAIQELL